MGSSEYSKLVSVVLELAVLARATCIQLLARRIPNDEGVIKV